MEILLDRENCSMASSWNEMLGVEQGENGNWILGTCMHVPVGGFDDLDDSQDLYDDNGEIIIPEEINGKKVLGVADGEYFYGEEIELNDPSITFDKHTINLALEFLTEEGWDTEENFDYALKKLFNIIGV